jgi:hypothetical protein
MFDTSPGEDCSGNLEIRRGKDMGVRMCTDHARDYIHSFVHLER